MSFREVQTPFVLPAIPSYQSALQGATAGAKTSESSVCLLLALQRSRGGVTFDADQLGSGAVSDGDVRGSVNAQSLKQIVDGFANGIAFFRWPTGYTELNPPNGHDGLKDLTDPEGYLSNPSWTTSSPPTGYQWFNSTYQLNNVTYYNLHRLPPTSPPGIRSYKLSPVVVSAGRNGLFGFTAFSVGSGGSTPFGVGDGTMTVNTASEDANDNIYSHRLRFGARGD